MIRLPRLVLALALAAVAASASGAQVLDRIVAVVNDGVILQSELDQAIDIARNEMRQRGISPPSANSLQSQVLEQLVLTKIQTQRADQDGIHVDDKQLNAALNEIAQRNHMTLSQFAAALKSEGIDFPTVREKVRDQILMQEVRQKEVDQRVVVTDQDVNLFLANERDNDQTEYHVSHILISIPDQGGAQAREKARAKAEKLDTELQNGGDFAQAAIANSADQLALKGGDLGWRKAGDLPTLFSGLLASMKVGQVSNVLEDSNGFHIIKLDGERSAGKQQKIE